ncbi:hypothetical protein B4073_2943 [Bacillus subtilis]|nr:hypothetical protein B4068_2967 [Bacillus subtilis]KIN46593.1 hypothetical protein B4073_2943 [Bacillus subtilis]GAK82050.1 hypothetical protein BSMD_039960 [Bacillus subtilis Miyagi-4]
MDEARISVRPMVCGAFSGHDFCIRQARLENGICLLDIHNIF